MVIGDFVRAETFGLISVRAVEIAGDIPRVQLLRDHHFLRQVRAFVVPDIPDDVMDFCPLRIDVGKVLMHD